MKSGLKKVGHKMKHPLGGGEKEEEGDWDWDLFEEGEDE
jgi:hypothetical protein